MKGSDIMNKLAIACNTSNYGGLRTQKIKYIVVHYTAGDGDTAVGNGRYFQNNPVKTSAHWFVDETTVVLSVPEDRVAWHCGAVSYLHPDCRNGNSIGVEICSRKAEDGTYYFADSALENAAELIRELMGIHGVPKENVIRHYDVTGKECPAPLMEAGLWEGFLNMVIRYQTVEETPEWARETIRKLVDRGVLRGDGQGLDLSYDMLRMLVLLDRSAVFS